MRTHRQPPRGFLMQVQPQNDFAGYFLSKVLCFSVGAFIGPTLTLAVDKVKNQIFDHFQMSLEDPCYFWKSFYIFVQKNSEVQSAVAVWKNTFFPRIFSLAVKHELLYRGLIQEVLFTKIPETLGYKEKLNTSSAKILRVVLTTAIFAASKHTLLDTESPIIKAEFVVLLIHEVILGGIKESNLGLSGSVGAHLLSSLGKVGAIYYECIYEN